MTQITKDMTIGEILRTNPDVDVVEKTVNEFFAHA